MRRAAALSCLAVSHPVRVEFDASLVHHDFDPQQTSPALWLCREHHFELLDFDPGQCLSLDVHSSAGIALFTDLLRNGTSCNVHNVHLEAAALGDAAAKFVATLAGASCPLRKLYAFANRIGDEGAAQLSGMARSLDVIDLGGNTISSVGASSLSALLQATEHERLPRGARYGVLLVLQVSLETFVPQLLTGSCFPSNRRGSCRPRFLHS